MPTIQPDFLLFVVLSTLIDLGVATGILFFRLPKALAASLPKPLRRLVSTRLTLGRCLFAAGLTGAVWLVKAAAAFVTLDLTLFGIITLAYVHVVISLPILGLLVLRAGKVEIDGVGTRSRATGLVRALAVVALLGLPVGVYASLVEPRSVVLERAHVTLAPERAGDETVTVAVLADVQTDRITEHHLALADRVMTLAPDVIIIPGDMYQPRAGLSGHDWSHIDEVAHGFRAFLRSLEAPGGVYFVPGNCELGYDVGEVLEGTGVVLLENDAKTARVRDRELLIAGSAFDVASAGARAFRDDLLRRTSGDDDPIVVFVSHVPDAVLALPEDARIDLTIAGHTHGGQVQAPGFGPLLTSSHVPRRIAAGGLNVHRGNCIYVSRGIGYEQGQAPPLRLFCPPEISLLSLR